MPEELKKRRAVPVDISIKRELGYFKKGGKTIAVFETTGRPYKYLVRVTGADGTLKNIFRVPTMEKASKILMEKFGIKKIF